MKVTRRPDERRVRLRELITPPSPEWPEDSLARMRAAVEEFGQPVYGLSPEAPAGEGCPGGTVSRYGGRQVSVRYQLTRADWVEVTTSSYPLGGTRGLMTALMTRIVPMKPVLPWALSLSERNVHVQVDGTRTQFHLVEASTGDWIAAGGFRRRGVRKRYLRLSGASGVQVEDVSLVPVAFDLTGEDGARSGERQDNSLHDGWVAEARGPEFPDGG